MCELVRRVNPGRGRERGLDSVIVGSLKYRNKKKKGMDEY